MNYDKVAEELANNVAKEIKSNYLENKSNINYGIETEKQTKPNSMSVLEEILDDFNENVRRRVPTRVADKFLQDYIKNKDENSLEEAYNFALKGYDIKLKYATIEPYLWNGDTETFIEKSKNISERPLEELFEVIEDAGKEFYFEKDDIEKTFEIFSLLGEDKYKKALDKLGKELLEQYSILNRNPNKETYVRDAYTIFKEIGDYKKAIKATEKLISMKDYSQALKNYNELEEKVKNEYENFEGSIKKDTMKKIKNDENDNLEGQIKDQEIQENTPTEKLITKENKSKIKYLNQVFSDIESGFKKLAKKAFKDGYLDVAYQANKKINSNDGIYAVAVDYLKSGNIDKFKEVGTEIRDNLNNNRSELKKYFKSDEEKIQAISDLINSGFEKDIDEKKKRINTLETKVKDTKPLNILLEKDL